MKSKRTYYVIAGEVHDRPILFSDGSYGGVRIRARTRKQAHDLWLLSANPSAPKKWYNDPTMKEAWDLARTHGTHTLSEFIRTA